jgi:hypothetical protein
MSSEQTFALDPGTTGKDTSDIEIILKVLGPNDYEISAKKGSGQPVICCPSRCPDGDDVSNGSNFRFTLKQVSGGYELEATGTVGDKQVTKIIGDSPSPISGWFQ